MQGARHEPRQMKDRKRQPSPKSAQLADRAHSWPTIHGQEFAAAAAFREANCSWPRNKWGVTDFRPKEPSPMLGDSANTQAKKTKKDSPLRPHNIICPRCIPSCNPTYRTQGSRKRIAPLGEGKKGCFIRLVPGCTSPIALLPGWAENGALVTSRRSSSDREYE